MPQNRVVYNKDLDLTYIMSPDGKTQIGHMEGDQSKNPLAYQMGQPGGNQPTGNQQPYNASTGPDKIKQMGKDFVVNAASMGPMMLGPELGLPARVLASLISGFGTDQVLNPDRNAAESLGQAGLNTGVSAAIELLPGIKMSGPPLLSKNAPVKGALFGKYGLISNLIPRLSYETDPLAAPVKTLAEKIGEVPPPTLRGPKGQFLKQSAIDAAKAAHGEAIKGIVVKDIMDRLKTFGKGLAVNEGIDQTVNRPE